MANNLYGYNDYHGPQRPGVNIKNTDDDDDDDGDDDDPLRSGLWMEGDSLAPPCGTSISVVHQILSFGSVSESDTLYDLGCGDGRVCLEAHSRNDCACTIGVEIEADLIQRFHELRSRLPNSHKIIPVECDLRGVLKALVERAEAEKVNLAKTKSNTETKTKPPNDAESSLATMVNSETNDLSRLPLPTVMILYLLPEAIDEIQDYLLSLLRLLPNFRLICNTWGLRRIEPTKTMEAQDGTINTTLFLYTHSETEHQPS